MFNFKSMSRIRKLYFARLAGRILILLAAALLLMLHPKQFDVLTGMRFFDSFSLLHLLWAVWVIDMIAQIIPIQKHISIGSLKMFRQSFRPIRDKVNAQALKTYIANTTRAAYKVMIVWCLLIAVIGFLYFRGVLSVTALFFITVLFYICDLICVLIWCPFRLMMKNRCCTTCRIFNWDHLMMFSPMLFVPSFYCWSLFGLSLLVFIIWEGCVILFPERFWEFSNAALQCANCTDKLCTQYCQKLRK